MSGYRGDGYGQYGNVGDDDFAWGRGGDELRRGAAGGNLMGRAEHEAKAFLEREGPERQRMSDDPRAVRAADQWRERFGREGYEGSYAPHDDAYRSYRERHLAEMDNDYAEYCRENGHEFSGAFESWRQSRREGSAVPAMQTDPAPEGALTDGPTAALGGEAAAASSAETPGRRGGRARR